MIFWPNANFSQRSHEASTLFIFLFRNLIFFFQFVLAALGSSVPAELQSGAHGIVRDISSGSQNYETDSSLFPINKPVEKYEARLQCTGEAIYANDIPILPSELHAAFVYSTMANCELDVVDTSVAMVSLSNKNLYFFWYVVIMYSSLTPC